METSSTFHIGDALARQARRRLAFNFAIVVLLLIPVEAFVISSPELDGVIATLM